MRRFAWPGTAIATRFTGTSIAIDLADSGDDYFEVTVDGVAQPPLHPGMGRATSMLATGLAAGDHDLVVAKRTESFVGVATFYSFPGATLVATPRATRLVELIGDSITCGYGVLGVGPSCSFSAATEAETHAWGTFAGSALGAAHAAIAYSGIGMYRNNAGDTTDQIPVIYNRTLADDPQSVWDFSYTPDVIVIDLGTNDFAQGDPGAPFVTAYTSFVQALQGHFATAKILLATSPMQSDPDRTTLHGYLDQVAAATSTTVVDIPEQLAADGYGCDYHPSETTHQKMAAVLVPAIRAATGW
jgi:lysophospholipase L1-like esterase